MIINSVAKRSKYTGKYVVLESSVNGKFFNSLNKLTQCCCGGFPLITEKGEKIFESSYPYNLKCSNCGKHTLQGSIKQVCRDWELIAQMDLKKDYAVIKAMYNLFISNKNS